MTNDTLQFITADNDVIGVMLLESLIAHFNDLKNKVPQINNWMEKLILGTIEERKHIALR